jgi:putative endonuclease
MTRKKTTKYSVYILEAADHTYYTGLTKDLKKRLELHNSGRGAKYLKGRLPVKLVYYEPAKNIKSAMKREIQIKCLPRSKKAQLITKS